jgi:hypothetical protein
MASVLFKQLVAASGLSPIFARTTMKRACERGGVAPHDLTRSDLLKVLPSIRQALETYLAPHVVEERMREIRRLSSAGLHLTLSDLRSDHHLSRE